VRAGSSAVSEVPGSESGGTTQEKRLKKIKKKKGNNKKNECGGGGGGRNRSWTLTKRPDRGQKDQKRFALQLGNLDREKRKRRETGRGGKKRGRNCPEARRREGPREAERPKGEGGR